MEKLIAAIIFDEEEDDLLVYCMCDSAADISVRGNMKGTTSHMLKNQLMHFY
jgi:hypothetical protein